ncbi:MAG: sulfatase-like hydrolase/transferase [Planctomycetota bacterium]|jgi:arylsulfatase A-like enzyme
MQYKRRDFLKAAGAGFCHSLLSPLSVLAESSKKKPNIVLCMADDQGWADMAYNGHPVLKTPNFDAMAASALRFDRFYAAAPLCSPTRGSVMTGRHPNRFGCFSWGNTLRPQEITIAENLKSAGYVTGHFGKWHLGSVCKKSPVNPGKSGFDEWFSAPNFFDNDPILSREGTAVQTRGESSIVTVDAALEFIRKHADADKPFLAVIWFGSPHSPHKAVEQDRKLYDGQPEKLRNFYGEITGMDRAFGKLRKEIQTLGIRENTILWFCSDNGGLPKVGSTGGRGNKAKIYEGGLRVPAILEWPAAIKAPRITNIPCNTSDIYPTLVEIAGNCPKKQLPIDGISLVPLIDGKMNSRPEPMGFWHFPEGGVPTPSKKLMEELLQLQKAGREVTDPVRLRFEASVITKQYSEDTFPGHAAWLDWPWKLHRIENKKTKIVRFELYNLEEDPMEKIDLVAKHQDRLEALKQQLQKWQLSVIQSLNGKDY